MQKYIRLHPADNVFIVIDTIHKDEQIDVDGSEICFHQTIPAGHKIAACIINQGESIIKYGVPIGLAKKLIRKGDYVHLHNVKSAYIPTYTLETKFSETNK